MCPQRHDDIMFSADGSTTDLVPTDSHLTESACGPGAATTGSPDAGAPVPAAAAAATEATPADVQANKDGFSPNQVSAGDVAHDRTPASTAAGTELEIVGGFKVHPAASAFPLLTGDDFDRFVASIERFGLREPVVFRGDVLLEGRNRVLAVEVLRKRGLDIELRRVQWVSVRGETAAEFIADVNFRRRHLTNDQRAIIAAELEPIIAAERAETQAQSRIKPGEVRNPAGRNGRGSMAAPKAAPPSKRDSRTKDARSTVGKIATVAKTSRHTARRAVEARRTASPDEIAAVKAGTKKLAEIAKPKAAKSKTAAVKGLKPINHPFKPRDRFEHDALRGWVRLIEGSLSVTERPRARRVFREIFKAEETAEKTNEGRKA